MPSPGMVMSLPKCCSSWFQVCESTGGNGWGLFVPLLTKSPKGSGVNVGLEDHFRCTLCFNSGADGIPGSDRHLWHQQNSGKLVVGSCLPVCSLVTTFFFFFLPHFSLGPACDGVLLEGFRHPGTILYIAPPWGYCNSVTGQIAR